MVVLLMSGSAGNVFGSVWFGPGLLDGICLVALASLMPSPAAHAQKRKNAEQGEEQGAQQVQLLHDEWVHLVG